MAQVLRRVALLLFFLPTLAFSVAQPAPEGPRWQQLNPQQQRVLAPLASDWDRLDAERKQKWLGIARHFSNLTPAQQAQVTNQMQRWASLTPEQRQLARKRYKSLHNLPPTQQQHLREKWERYQAMSPEQRSALAARPPARPPAVPPRP